MLRDDDAEPELAPQPSLDRLDTLIGTMRERGLDVELEVEGEERELPPGIDLSAYRLLQEGLTNVLRSVGPSQAWVALRWSDHELELEIGDEGRHGRDPDRRPPQRRWDARARGAHRRHARHGAPGRGRVRHPRPAPAGRGRLTVHYAALGRRLDDMSVRVLIVDDQSLVRAGFRMILDAEPEIEVVGEAADGLEAVLAARQTEPDVILMDIRMPNVDGLEATRRLLDGRTDGPRVLILTTFDLDEYVYEALRAGASGFLLKDTPPEQLVDAIMIVSRGDALLSPSITRRVIEEFVRRPPASARRIPPELEELTAREREMLGLIAKGLSNAEIARAAFVSETTVKTHVAHILMKLRLRDRVQAVVYAYENGVVQAGDD